MAYRLPQLIMLTFNKHIFLIFYNSFYEILIKYTYQQHQISQPISQFIPPPPPALAPPQISGNQFSSFEFLQRQGLIPKNQPLPPQAPKPKFQYQNKKPEKNYIQAPSKAKVLGNPELDTPEEISKWIEQRKKNYPTKRKIEAKQKTEKIIEERGALGKKELSKLELKLRKKIKFMQSEFGEEDRIKKNKKRKYEKSIQKKSTVIEKPKEMIQKPVSDEIEEGEIILPKNSIEQQSQQIVEKTTPKPENIPKHVKFEKKPKKEQKKQIRYDRMTYRKNNMFSELMKNEEAKEHSILLQICRYFVKNKIV